MDQKELHMLHQAEMEIMDVVHDFCKEHNLKYSLAYGTLLGAVRHKGFIPWDDDMDICMPRNDYDKFIELWGKNPPNGFILQYKDNSPEFSQNFVKIRKDHTAFIYFEEEKQFQYHKGIFVDIFPGDNVPDGSIARKVQFCFTAIMLLFYREFTSGSTGIIGKIEKVLLSFPKRFYPSIRKWAERQIKHWNTKKTKQIVFGSTIRDASLYYDSSIFNNLNEFSFEDRHYYGFADYDEVLKVEYGSYMELPPEEERVLKHQPYMVDFMHNYEEL